METTRERAGGRRLLRRRTVRPRAPARRRARGRGRPRTADPPAKVHELVEKAFAESEDSKFDYDEDVAPWLGENVALWGSIPTATTTPGLR